MASQSRLAGILNRRSDDIISKWIDLQATGGKKVSAAERAEISAQSREFMNALGKTAEHASVDNIGGSEWDSVREILGNLSAARAKGGYSPSETASFVFSMKEPLFNLLSEEYGKDASALAEAIWQATQLLDKLGLYTAEAFIRTREEVITRQQDELLELSTPVVQLWDNVLALPLIGTLDSSRTQVVMQNLLEAIVTTRSDFAIIDITGVPVVDTLVAQHLLKTVSAARLMGADCLISGIRPQIAQTIIHLGVDLTNVTTKATLADAFAVALQRSGKNVVKVTKSSGAGVK